MNIVICDDERYFVDLLEHITRDHRQAETYQAA